MRVKREDIPEKDNSEENLIKEFHVNHAKIFIINSHSELDPETKICARIVERARESILCPLRLLLLTRLLLLLLLTRLLLLLLLRHRCCWLLLPLLTLLVKEASDLVVGEPLILQRINEPLLLVLSTCWGIKAII